MNDKRSPEGNRMQMPGWEPAEDNAARPYLDQVADLQAKLAEKEAGRPAGVSDAEAEKSRRAERDTFFKSLVIKLDGAARRSVPGVVEDIDAKFNALQDYLTEADRLQMQMGPGKQPIYKVLERAADGKSKLTMGELEAARGHFLSWHGLGGQPVHEAPTPPAAPPAGGVLGMVFGMARKSSQELAVQERSSAHLKAYFGKNFRKFHKAHSSRSFGFLKVGFLSIFLCLGAVLFYQGMDSHSDKFDDALGFFGRIKYNMAKLRASTAQDEVPEFAKRYVGQAFIDDLNSSDSPDLVTVALKASFAEQGARLEEARANLASKNVSKIAAQANENLWITAGERGKQNIEEAVEQERIAKESRLYEKPKGDRALVYMYLAASLGQETKDEEEKYSRQQADIISEYIEKRIQAKGEFSDWDSRQVENFILTSSDLNLSMTARQMIVNRALRGGFIRERTQTFADQEELSQLSGDLVELCKRNMKSFSHESRPESYCDAITQALASSTNSLTVNLAGFVESLMERDFSWARSGYYAFRIVR